MDVPNLFSIAFSFDTVYWHTIVAISVSLQVVILIVTFVVAFQIFFIPVTIGHYAKTSYKHKTIGLGTHLYSKTDL